MSLYSNLSHWRFQLEDFQFSDQWVVQTSVQWSGSSTGLSTGMRSTVQNLDVPEINTLKWTVVLLLLKRFVKIIPIIDTLSRPFINLSIYKSLTNSGGPFQSNCLKPFFLKKFFVEKLHKCTWYIFTGYIYLKAVPDELCLTSSWNHKRSFCTALLWNLKKRLHIQ